MRLYVLTAALALAFVSTSAAMAADAAAPAPKPALVRGTIVSFDGKVLTIKKSNGETLSAPVTTDTRVAAVESRTFAQLKSTDFVGITSVDGPDGRLIAEEIRIIPVVGMGEGQYPWDHHPDGAATGPVRAGSMTNGTVEAPAAKRMGSMTNGTIMSGDKQELKVTFHGSQMVDGKCVGRAAPGGTGCVGTAIVDVTPKTYIQAIVAAKRDDLKSGLSVVALVLTYPDGSAIIGSATVEKNGVKPEF